MCACIRYACAWADCQIKIRQLKKQAFWPNLPNIIPANFSRYKVYIFIRAESAKYNSRQIFRLYIRALIKIVVKYVGNQTSFKFVKISDEAYIAQQQKPSPAM